MNNYLGLVKYPCDKRSATAAVVFRIWASGRLTRKGFLVYVIDMGEEEKTPEATEQIPGAKKNVPDYRMFLGPREVGLKFNLEGGKMELALPLRELTEIDVQTALASLETAMVPFEELLQKFLGKTEVAITWN